MTNDAGPNDAGPPEAKATLTPSGRRVRLGVAGLVFGLLLAGTFYGSDDLFPLGPFRMYATSSQATGEIAVVALEARTAGGEWTLVRPSPNTVGMNVAEFEGQLPRFESDHDLLGAVASSRESLHPDEDPWVAVRIIREATVVVDKVPTGEVRRTLLAEWSDSTEGDAGSEQTP